MIRQDTNNIKQDLLFGDIAECISVRVNPEPGGEKKYIGLEHLDSGSLTVNRWGSDVVLKGQKLSMKKGDVLFAKRNAYLKRVSISPFDGIFSAHGMVIRPLSKHVLPDFLPFFMQSSTFMSRAISISEGSVSPTIKWKTLAAQRFVIPSINEQAKIVKIGRLVQSIQNQIWKLDLATVNLANSLTNSTLEKNSLHKRKLKELVDLQVGFAFKSKNFADEGVALMRGANVGVKKPDWENGKKFLPTGLAKNFDDYQLCSGDILIAMDRPFTGAGFKVSRLSNDDIPCLLVQRVGRFRTFKGISPEYLWLLLNSKFVKGFLKSQQKGMDIPHLSKKEILDCEVPVLPVGMQHQLSKTVNSLFSHRELLEQKLEIMRKIQTKLMD
ncbi:hypothetical protein FCV62_13625 [Vibrio kanaloae]|uniref:restriction endonuclease subunit S n=1 Tax=Vibrio kanaloae TaxID=170673 RepID=UPI0010BEBE30|nr:restriction endonuclease subunit S [Vibrio kanaloae]TKF78080.1 hypothetical protein FCV62_13625 [Vibrio kanaloae]